MDTCFKNDPLSITISDSVLQKIIKHSNSVPQQILDEEQEITGKLLGYFDENTGQVDISTCFAVPNYPITEDEEKNELNQENKINYSKIMQENLAQTHIDTLEVGWYQISHKKDNFVSFRTFETQKQNQMINPLFVYLVYDILDAKNGNPMPFKAYRLNQKMMNFSDMDQIQQEYLKNYTTKDHQIFLPLPLEIKRSALTTAFLSLYGDDVKQQYVNKQISTPTIEVGTSLQKNANCLTAALEDLYEDNVRTLKRQKVQRQNVQDKKQEKMLVEPSKYIDTKLINERVQDLAQLINQQSTLNQKSQIVLDGMKSNQ